MSFSFKPFDLAATETAYMIKFERKELYGFPPGISRISCKECGDEDLITFMGHYLLLVRSHPP